MLNFDLTPEQKQLQETARRFAREEIIPVAARYDEEEIFPQDVTREAWNAGLMNLEVPAEHGGPGLGVVDACLVFEELTYGCAGITDAIGANALAALPVLIAGTPAQKAHYLGQLTAAPSFAAFCLTEPGAGSDVAGMSTAYLRVGDDFVLNGTKHFRYGTGGHAANVRDGAFGQLSRKPLHAAYRPVGRGGLPWTPTATSSSACWRSRPTS